MAVNEKLDAILVASDRVPLLQLRLETLFRSAVTIRLAIIPVAAGICYRSGVHRIGGRLMLSQVLSYCPIEAFCANLRW